ncbi:MAG: hypothetical protein AB8B73_05505 [Ekhidna sp.]
MIKTITLFFIGLIVQQAEYTSFDMTRRVNAKGKTIESKATILFKENGDMMTKYDAPLETVVFNNLDGEIKIYNERENTIIQSVNYHIGTSNSNFFFFLKGNTESMGLSELGFKLMDSKVDNGLIITEWASPKGFENNVDRIELVHRSGLPVFMGHKSRKGDYLRKTFFYDYELINDYIDFPKSITEIEYVEADSLISKTQYSNFKFDSEVDPSLQGYQIPSNAKVIK